MADIVQFDLPNALASHYKLQEMQQGQQDQNALSQAVPMLQTDPQNAFATAAKSSPTAALKLLPIIKQMDDEKKAKAADVVDALGKLAYSLKTQYPDPLVRKAVAQSQAASLAAHGITPDQIQNFDYSDQNLQTTINNSQNIKDLIAQSNTDRTYQAGRDDHKDTVAYQDKQLAGQAATRAETARHNQATEQQAATSGEFGKSINGKAYNILAAGLKDPSARSTPEYATAWQILSNPHVDPNTGTVVVPDLSAFAAPTGGNGGAPPPQRMPSVQSFAPPNPSQAEALSAGFSTRMAAANIVLAAPDIQAASIDMGQIGRSKVPVIGNKLVNAKFQQADQAKRDFINAQLRRESGAAIAPSEFENADKQYFAQYGDSKEVIAQKNAARERAVRNMELSAGNTLLAPGVIQQSSPPPGAQMIPQQQGFGVQGPAANDPLGIRH